MDLYRQISLRIGGLGVRELQVNGLKTGVVDDVMHSGSGVDLTRNVCVGGLGTGRLQVKGLKDLIHSG